MLSVSQNRILGLPGLNLLLGAVTAGVGGGVAGNAVGHYIQQGRAVLLDNVLFPGISIDNSQRIVAVHTLSVHLAGQQAGADPSGSLIAHGLTVGLTSHTVAVVPNIEQNRHTGELIAPEGADLIHGAEDHALPNGTAGGGRITNVADNDAVFVVGEFIEGRTGRDRAGAAYDSIVGIDAEGGEENIRYGIGLSYGNVQGVMKGSDRQTISGNIDLIYRSGKFQFSNKLTVDYMETNDPSVSFSEYAQANPYYKKYNEDGGIDKYLYYYSGDGYEEKVANPLWNASLNNYDKSDETGFTNNFIIEWFATDDLRARGKFGITKTSSSAEERLSPEHSDFDDEEEMKKGSYTHTASKSTSYEGDIAVTYGRLFGGKHMINAVGGFNFSLSKETSNGYKAIGFTEDAFGSPSFANGYPENGKSSYSESETRAASFYLNGGYAYDNRYLLDFNYRSDGASMFGTNNRFRNTWSVGIGWNLHNEAFFHAKDWFQLLKLRASVGNPGNQNFSAYQAFTTYTFNTDMTNIFGSGLVINALGNKDLAWQETINWNAGADITTWNNRLNITFDWYKKITDPLLALITTPGSMGVKSVAMNAGQQKTTGIEVTLKVSPIYRPQERINWNISLNGTHAKARYAKIGNAFSSLNEEQKASLAGTTRYYDGGSPTAIWAVRSAGIDPATGKELFIKKDGSYSFTYDTDDEVVLGDTEPKLEGVIGTTLYYKGLSVGCYFRYTLGAQIFNESVFEKVENISSDEVYNNQDKRALYNRWSATNREAQYKGISLTQTTDKSSRFVMDENTISGESFNIGYEFTQPFVKRMGLSVLNIQAIMNDLFRCSSVKSERGIDYPFARTVSFSLSATF